jgi:hypothetical protein
MLSKITGLSIVSLTEDDKTRWRDHPQVKCAIGGFAWMFEKMSSGILLEANYGGNDPLSDEVAANDVGSLIAFLDVRLPYALWTPFGEHRLLGWPEGDFKIVALGDQRFPTEMEAYAKMNVDDEAFLRYWSEILDQSDTGRRLRRALGRHRHARTSMYREDAILNAFIGLEALFGDHTKAGRIPEKVTRRATRFILDPEVSQSVADLVAVSTSIRELYEFRHTIVHGAEPDESRSDAAAKRALRLLSTVINIALEEGFDRLSDRKLLAQAYDKALLDAQRNEKRDARNKRGHKKRIGEG